MSIPVHWLDLAVIETHLNTRMIIGDMQCLLGGGGERDEIKCKLRCFFVGILPLEVLEGDIQTIAIGLKVT